MFIYCITNTVNGKRYVGQVSSDKSLSRRWIEHLGEARRGSTRPLHAAIRKYGSQGFSVSVLQNGVQTQQRLDELEVSWIVELNSLAPNGYNLTEGGLGKSGYKFSEESKQILKDLWATESFREIQRTSRLKAWQSRERRIAQSQRAKTRKHSNETKMKIAVSQVGREFSKDTKLKLRAVWTPERRKAQAERMRMMRKGIQHVG